MNTKLVLNTKLNETDYTDRRRKTALVIDVETALSKDNEQLIFDIGWTVSEVSNQRKVMHRSYLVQEVFLDIKLMERAFYFNKFPLYLLALGSGNTTLTPFDKIIQQLNADIKEFNCSTLYAYNATFDSTAINKTNKYINGAELIYEIDCLWNMSTQSFMNTKKFVRTAFANLWTTEKGNVKTSAEMAYRYLTKDFEFVEAHTATEDSSIETEILWAINKYGAKVCRKKNGAPWYRIKLLKDKMGL